jgi:protein-S-isoprenylcysteine O-methyltransferase Ste14
MTESDNIEMRSFQKKLDCIHPLLLGSIAGVLTIAQIILAFLLHREGSGLLRWTGWIFLWTSSIFGILPIITFHLKGGVSRGKSYIHTTVLVDSGIYALVRHPQGGTAWLLINLGIILIAQHWTSLFLGVSSMILAYVDTFKADRQGIEKFGDAYRQYMNRVPRINFFSGIIRLFIHRLKVQ